MSTPSYTHKDIQCLKEMLQESHFDHLSRRLSFEDLDIITHSFFIRSFFIWIVSFDWLFYTPSLIIRSKLGMRLNKREVEHFKESILYSTPARSPLGDDDGYVKLVFDVPLEELFTQIGLGEDFSIRCEGTVLKRVEQLWDLLIQWRYAIGK